MATLLEVRSHSFPVGRGQTPAVIRTSSSLPWGRTAWVAVGCGGIQCARNKIKGASAARSLRSPDPRDSGKLSIRE